MKPWDLLGEFVNLEHGPCFRCGILRVAGPDEEWWCIEDERDGTVFVRQNEVKSVSRSKPMREIRRDLEIEGGRTPDIMR